MNTTLWTRAIAGVLAVALAATGCSREAAKPSASDRRPVDPAAQATVNKLRSLPFTEDSAAVVTDVLRGAGVGVYDNDSTGGNEPVQLTRWQVRNLAVQAANASGVTGDTLAALAPVPQDVPPIGYLLAGWAIGYDSPGAKFAQALLGDQDLTKAGKVVFPKVVLTLFIADATAHSRQSPGALALVAQTQYAELAGPCSAAANFIQHAIGKVADVLKVNASGGLLGFLGTIWNFAVDLAATVVKGLLTIVAQPVINAMVDVFGIVATIQQVASYLTEWRASISFDPASNWFGVDAQVVTGTAKLHVVDSQLPVPEIIVDCAKTVGVDLSKAGSAEGSVVVWDTHNDPRDDLATVVKMDLALDAKRDATLTYRTGQETAKQAASPEVRGGIFTVKASIKRNDVERAKELLQKLVYDQIPGWLLPIVTKVADPIFNAAKDSFGELIDVHRTEIVRINFHGEPPPPPDSQAGAQGPGGCTGQGTVQPGTYQGTINEQHYQDGPLENTQSGTVDFTVAPDGKLSGTFTVKAKLTSAGQPVEGWELVNTHLSGSVSNPAASFEWDFGGERLPMTVDHMPAFTSAGGCKVHGALNGVFHSATNDPDAHAVAQNMTNNPLKWEFDAEKVG